MTVCRNGILQIMGIEQTMKDLHDTLIVVEEIQARQTSVQKLHAEELDAVRTMLREGLATHEKRMAEHDRSMAELDRRIEALVSAFGEFLRQMRQG